MEIRYEFDATAAGKRIKRERKSKKLTQEKMAEKLGVTSKYLSKVENGRRTPSLAFMLNFSDYTGASLDYLLKGEINTGQGARGRTLKEEAFYGEGLSEKQRDICETVIRSLAESLIRNDV